ncbi:hypothetical protein OIU84_019854 [Salix udensis]|uniref:Uncharacterized protein n=1 Tax=Salix udensis TaxID=889485 RepID=A0AAD6KZW0_9ROSI|nr:hypothetical protein OIU84_019854 [Salix udensis]
MCTLEKRGDIYILTLTGSDEHRLNPTLVDSIRSALRRVRAGPASPSSALVTIAEGKFFSNGSGSCLGSFIPTTSRTHVSKASIAALSHDYVLMRKDRGFLYMSELDIGLVLPDWFMVLLKCKIGDAKVRSEIILTAAKLTAEMAAVRGVVHSAHVGAEETVEAAIRLGQELVKRGWDGNVYGKNRMVVFNEVLEKIGAVTGEAKTVSKL